MARIAPEDLLAVAKALAASSGSRGRPPSAPLRRSVSTAYYALFHAVVEAATGLVVGRGQDRRKDRDRIARVVTHGDLKNLCSRVDRTVGHGGDPLFCDVDPGLAEVRAPW